MILIELQPIAPERQALRLHIIVDCAAKQMRRLRITADCARHRVACATQTRRYGFHFEKKIGAIVGTFGANYRRLRPADRRTDTFSISTIINIDNQLIWDDLFIIFVEGASKIFQSKGKRLIN